MPFSADLEAVLVIGLADEVHGAVTDDGHVFGSVSSVEPGEVRALAWG